MQFISVVFAIGYGKDAMKMAKDEWTANMKKLRNRLQNKAYEISKNYHKQMTADVDDLILRNARNLGNEALMNKIYDFLTAKYEWRFWFVAVYDDVIGYDNHYIRYCGGVTRLHQVGDKNVVVASTDKKYAARYCRMLSFTE